LAQLGLCPLCGHRGVVTQHHAIWPRRIYHRHPMREILIILICRECHDMIHYHYDHTRYKNMGGDKDAIGGEE